MSYHLNKVLELDVPQTKELSQFLFVTINISSDGLVSALNSIVPLQGPPQGLKSSL